MSIFYLIIGLTLLAFSANWLVESAVTISKKMKLSSAVIGFTVVAAGTSMPELATSVFAALDGNSEIALGNVIGSNIFNIVGILGIAGIITPNLINQNSKKIEIPMMMFSFIVILICSINLIISRIEGIMFLIILCFFVYYLIKNSKITHEIVEGHKNQNTLLTSFILIGSLIGLVVGSQFVLTGSIEIGKLLGLSDRVIGLTIVSIGTSLPEIGATVAAAIKGEKEMAVANVVGSNLFNAFGILGITALAQPITVDPKFLSTDLIFMMVAGLILWLLAFVKPTFHKKEGYFLISLTIGYLCYLTLS